MVGNTAFTFLFREPGLLMSVALSVMGAAIVVSIGALFLPRNEIDITPLADLRIIPRPSVSDSIRYLNRWRTIYVP